MWTEVKTTHTYTFKIHLYKNGLAPLKTYNYNTSPMTGQLHNGSISSWFTSEWSTLIDQKETSMSTQTLCSGFKILLFPRYLTHSNNFKAKTKVKKRFQEHKKIFAQRTWKHQLACENDKNCHQMVFLHIIHHSSLILIMSLAFSSPWQGSILIDKWCHAAVSFCTY